MQNQIFINPEGYVEAKIVADQSYMSFESLRYDAEELLQKLQDEGKRRLGLIDLTHQGKFTADSNRSAMQVLEALNYEKTAIFGANKILTEITKAIIIAMGKSANTKIFPDRKSAVKWLLSND
ncbi:MAG TPA: hypothetical protein VLF63_01175 [Patescibacteria group bacterium]|nr:hypothetical protein [Patescibacteria group bacterium]